MISLVIPTVQGRERYLRILLQSLVSSRIPEAIAIEVIIVYDGDCSTNGLTDVEIIDDSRFSIRLIRNTHKVGGAKARNDGIRASKGRIVCFLDDDVIIHPDYFSGLISNYDIGADGVLGKIWLAPSYVRSRSFDELWRIADAQGFHDGGISGANMSFRRAVLISLGGFDERLGLYSYSEDYDLIMRAKIDGLKTNYCELCRVIHFKATSGGIEGSGLSVSKRIYWSVSNDTYVLLKNEPAPINFLKALRKSFQRIRNEVASGREGRVAVLLAFYLSIPRAYIRAALAYLQYKRSLKTTLNPVGCY